MGFGRIFYLVGIAVAITLFMRACVVEPISIASASMEPTLLTGVSVFTDKLTLNFRGLKRGDIIVFVPPAGESAHELVKRVIALPGETVELREKKVFINGEELRESYVQHKRKGEILKGDTLGPLVVPRNRVFVLGDNRDESRDSSSWADPFLPVANVRGVVRGAF
jgi:signal peptidase I